MGVFVLLPSDIEIAVSKIIFISAQRKRQYTEHMATSLVS